ncbi:MAG TPA: hypothetical protein VHA52_08295, partial [Candidatus Babeliaceae bacterium]|nr:hypothetical protein [Candidatus Babeliaceae bacterium]
SSKGLNQFRERLIQLKEMIQAKLSPALQSLSYFLIIQELIHLNLFKEAWDFIGRDKTLITTTPIIEDMLQKGLKDRALAMVKNVEDDELKEDLLRIIIVNVAKLSPDKATELAREHCTGRFLASVLQSIADLHPQEAIPLLKEATAAIETLPDENPQKPFQLRLIAEALAQHHAFSAALNIGNRINAPHEQNACLIAIAKEFIKQGRESEALAIALDPTHETIKAYILQPLITKYAKEGKREKALKLVDHCKNDEDKSYLLYSLVTYLPKTTQEDQKAAMEIAHSIPNANIKIRSLVGIAWQLKDEKIISEVLERVNERPDGQTKFSSLSILSRILMAMEKLDQACAIMDTIPAGSEERDAALHALSLKLAKQGLEEEALKTAHQIFSGLWSSGIFSEIFEIVVMSKESLPSSYIKKFAENCTTGFSLQRFIETLAKLGYIEEAYDLIPKLQDSNDKCNIYRFFASFYAAQGKRKETLEALVQAQKFGPLDIFDVQIRVGHLLAGT